MKAFAIHQFSMRSVALIVCTATWGCDSSKDAEPEQENSQPVIEQPERHPHDGATAPGAGPHGVGPHGAGPHPGSAPPAAPAVAISWDVPDGWKEAPRRSMMRAATYEAPGVAGAAEVAVFYFGPGQGGDVESNITRWIGQFKDTPEGAVERSTRDANGLKQYLVHVKSGTFSSGMPGGPTAPQKSWAMFGAIVEAPSGSYFFKMTGPEKTVGEQSEAFEKLLNSTKPKG